MQPRHLTIVYSPNVSGGGIHFVTITNKPNWNLVKEQTNWCLEYWGIPALCFDTFEDARQYLMRVV